MSGWLDQAAAITWPPSLPAPPIRSDVDSNIGSPPRRPPYPAGSYRRGPRRTLSADDLRSLLRTPFPGSEPRSRLAYPRALFGSDHAPRDLSRSGRPLKGRLRAPCRRPVPCSRDLGPGYPATSPYSRRHLLPRDIYADCCSIQRAVTSHRCWLSMCTRTEIWSPCTALQNGQSQMTARGARL